MLDFALMIDSFFRISIGAILGVLLGDVLFPSAAKLSLAFMDASIIEVLGKVAVFAAMTYMTSWKRINEGVSTFYRKYFKKDKNKKK